jgi:hypothetical protein
VPGQIARKSGLPIDAGFRRVRDASQEHAGNLEIVVPYTGRDLTAKVMTAAVAMAQGLNASIQLVAV